MAKMNEKVKGLLESVPTAMLATSAPDGTPNAVPIGAKMIIDDETILIGDQFFQKTLANLKANPKASISYWEGMNGYQVKGSTEILSEGPLFDKVNDMVKSKGAAIGIPLQSKNVIKLTVTEVFYTTPGPKAGKPVE